jgi:hypothetical protein
VKSNKPDFLASLEAVHTASVLKPLESIRWPLVVRSLSSHADSKLIPFKASLSKRKAAALFDAPHYTKECARHRATERLIPILQSS